jgi:DNA-binding transcriptional LysR family regulator
MQMDRFTDLSAFAAVIEAGSLAKAGQTLALSPSGVSKLISRLENRLGARLLNRTTRRLSPTPEGEALYVRARRILDDVAEAEQEVQNLRGAPRGRLSVASSIALGTHRVAPLVPEFLARYPEIHLDLTLTDAPVDPIEAGLDMALVFGPLPDSRLMVRKLGESRRLICAAPAYLARHGRPETPADLAGHNCLNFSNRPDLNAWPIARPGRPPVDWPVTGNFAVNSGEILFQMTLAGLGIMRLAEFIVGPMIAQGRLVPLLEGFVHDPPLPIQAVYPHKTLVSPRVSAFLDFLGERLGRS